MVPISEPSTLNIEVVNQYFFKKTYKRHVQSVVRMSATGSSLINIDQVYIFFFLASFKHMLNQKVLLF